MTWRPSQTGNQPLLTAHQVPPPHGHFRTAALLLVCGQSPWSRHSRGVSATWSALNETFRHFRSLTANNKFVACQEMRASGALRTLENVIVRRENKNEWLEDHLIRRLRGVGIEDNVARALAHELQHDILVGFGVIDSRNAQQDQLELDVAREVSEGGHDA